jgi:hypothetical protein
LLDAIHAATVEALRIPPDALVLRLVEHPMDCFAIPHGTAEQYTHIVITMFAVDHSRPNARSTKRSFGTSSHSAFRQAM